MPRIDYSLLVIDNLIIHDVPKHKKGDFSSGPNHSENESTITDGLRIFFQDKIKAALNSDQSFNVCFKEETSSSVPICVNSIINSDSSFVDQSKDIATNLYNFQKGNNAAGILLIVKGHIAELSICVILKLERDNGAQLVLNEDTKTFNVEEVQDLMLTKKTKIFKVAIFINRIPAGTDYDGRLMDYQINPKNKKEINTFFLDFMGCVPYSDPKISTKRFYELTRKFLDTIPDEIIRSQYIQDLNSYLRKIQATISPREFAEDYMASTQHKNQYREYLQSQSFEFTNYTKDNTLINSHINKIIMEFENGISILGANGSFEDKVSFSKDEQTGECRAEIKSKIKKVK